MRVRLPRFRDLHQGPTYDVAQSSRMNDLMIDLETLATTPDALILSIGAVFFDRHIPGKLGAEFYRRIQFDQRHGRVCGNTLSWWMEKRSAWPDGEAQHLAPALVDFASFIILQTEDVGLRPVIWGHGADFDPPILHSAYLACGMDRPWGKGQVRDTRTLFDLAGYRWSTEGPRDGVHHALEDAKAAARAVQEAMQKLRSERR